VGADGTGADPAKTQRDDVMVAMAAEDRLNVREGCSRSGVRVMDRPRKAAKMSEWVLHCEFEQRHIRRGQPTKDAALKDACSQLLQGHTVNRIVGPNETINAERVKRWCAEPRTPYAVILSDMGLQAVLGWFDRGAATAR
jgi:hypothetical protein